MYEKKNGKIIIDTFNDIANASVGVQCPECGGIFVNSGRMGSDHAECNNCKAKFYYRSKLDSNNVIDVKKNDLETGMIFDNKNQDCYILSDEDEKEVRGLFQLFSISKLENGKIRISEQCDYNYKAEMPKNVAIDVLKYMLDFLVQE